MINVVTVRPLAAAYEAFLPLATSKVALKVRHSAEDSLIRQFADTAIQVCERVGRISILPCTRQATYRAPEHKEDDLGIISHLRDPDQVTKGIRLLYGPITGVSSVALLSVEGSPEVYDTGLYRLDGDTIRWNGNLTPAYRSQIRVTYTAGIDVDDEQSYGDLVNIRTAVSEVLVAMYENRGIAEATLSNVARRCLSRYWTSPTFPVQ